MKIKKTDVPSHSLTVKYLPADYSDVFTCEIPPGRKINPDDLMIAFWSDFPRWVNTLFKLRNFLVKFVGLKGAENNDLQKQEACVRTGGSYGLASIPAKNDNETVMLLTDKHLDAYMSVFVEYGVECTEVSVITLVHFKNKLGRIYFFFVRPFHGLVVKKMLERSVKNYSR